MTDIKSMTQQELSQFLKELGEPAFRAKQVFTWLHRGAASFDEMTNLSKSLREKLKGRCFITAPVVARKQESRLDGTIKYLWELSDGNCIETVLMQYHHGNTVCIRPKWAAAWAAPSVPAPSPERCGICGRRKCWIR